MSLEKPGDFINFTKLQFTTEYYDKESDLPFDVMILSLPEYGVLKYNKNIINNINFVFSINNVNLLTYTRISKLEYTENIDFKTSDDNPNKLYSNMATMTINVDEYINLPPNQIGDNERDTPNGQTVIFTRADFTTNTTPPYQDPENNPAYKLKILSLPLEGLLKINSVNVTLNQELLFTDIDTGLFTYEPSSNTDDYVVDFDFDVSDTGSQQFSGL